VSKYRGKSPSTDQFIALAGKVSRQDVKSFLEAWLYSSTTPPMPGHPDWTVTPVPPASVASVQAAPALVSDRFRPAGH